LHPTPAASSDTATSAASGTALAQSELRISASPRPPRRSAAPTANSALLLAVQPPHTRRTAEQHDVRPLCGPGTLGLGL
jgi:hypothetical protein